MISVVIPARNEKYLHKTIRDVLQKSKEKIEIIAVLDGYWPDPDDIIEDPRVHYIHVGKPKGMRNAINQGVALSAGEYILKCDAHCMFSKGFDEVLKADCDDNTVVVLRRYALDPEKWELESNPKYPIDYMYLSNDLHGRVWHEKNKDEQLKRKEIDDLMSAQGSMWFMKREYFDYLELMDEYHWGEFAREFQEIGLKAWLSGGRVIVNKKAWYAHWHKSKADGRGYSLDRNEIEKANKYVLQFFYKLPWAKQKYKFNYLLDKFKPIPTWTI